MAFVSKKGGDFWNPRKDEQGVERINPTGNPAIDTIEGWYLGLEKNQGQDKNSTLYSILNENEEILKEAWGTALLDEIMAKIKIGSFIRIVWLGKKQPKIKTNRPYHDWDVLVDDSRGIHKSVANNAPVIQSAAPVMAAADSPLAPPF